MNETKKPTIKDYEELIDVQYDENIGEFCITTVKDNVGNVMGDVGNVCGTVKGSVRGNVEGNVMGDVGSVWGDVGTVEGDVGSVNGNVWSTVKGDVGSVEGKVGNLQTNMTNMSKTLIPDRPIPQTLQDFFNIAWNWANRPDFERCVENNVACYYRSPDGTNACIIGAAIPDSLYDPAFEDMNLNEVFETLGIQDREDLYYRLEVLQNCHDEATDESDCIEQMRCFAEHYGLTIPEQKHHLSKAQG